MNPDTGKYAAITITAIRGARSATADVGARYRVETLATVAALGASRCRLRGGRAHVRVCAIGIGDQPRLAVESQFSRIPKNLRIGRAFGGAPRHARWPE